MARRLQMSSLPAFYGRIEFFDNKTRNITTTVISSLKKTLHEYGIEDILVRSWGHLSVDITKFQCDAYDFEKWDAVEVNSFHGEYMVNYSWAEFTTGKISYYIKINLNSPCEIFAAMRQNGAERNKALYYLARLRRAPIGALFLTKQILCVKIKENIFFWSDTIEKIFEIYIMYYTGACYWNSDGVFCRCGHGCAV